MALSPAWAGLSMDEVRDHGRGKHEAVTGDVSAPELPYVWARR